MLNAHEVDWRAQRSSRTFGASPPPEALLSGLAEVRAEVGLPSIVEILCGGCGDAASYRLLDLAVEPRACPSCATAVPFQPYSSELRGLIDHLVHLAQGRTASQPLLAEVLLRDVLEVDPWHPHAHHLLAIVVDERGAHEEALAHFERAAALGPERSEYRFSLGFCLEQLGRVERARAEFEAAVSLSPDHIKAIGHLAICYAVLGQPLAAMIASMRVMQMDPVGGFFALAVTARVAMWDEVMRQEYAPGVGVWDFLARFRPGGRRSRAEHRRRDRHIGHLDQFYNAYFAARNEDWERASLLYRGLLDSLDEGPSRSVVWSCLATVNSAAGRHLAAARAREDALRLSCAEALVPSLVRPSGDPALRIELVTMFGEVLEESFDLEIAKSSVELADVRPADMSRRYLEELSAVLGGGHTVLDLIGWPPPDEHLVPGGHYWEYRATTPHGPFRAVRAGHAVAITLPDGDVVIRHLGQGAGRQMAEW